MVLRTRKGAKPNRGVAGCSMVPESNLSCRFDTISGPGRKEMTSTATSWLQLGDSLLYE